MDDGGTQESTRPKTDELTLVSTAKRQWERTFDAISDPLMIVDDGFVVRRANLALAEHLSVPIQQVVGRTCHEVRRQSSHAFPGELGCACAGCPVREAIRDGAPRDGEIAAASGRSYRLRAYPLSDPQMLSAFEIETTSPGPSPLVVCSYRDVTDERELARQMASTEKLAAIGRLAGGVAHEINNPLGGILAFAQILLRENCPPDEQLEYLREIEKSAFRCKAIVEALLRFSRQSPRMQRAPLFLNDVVREALTLVTHRFTNVEVRLRCDLDESLPAISGNANQLEQVLVSLLSNAYDATIAAPSMEESAIELSTRLKSDEVELVVSDRGTGIDEGHLAKIFDPFFTTKEAGKGTGLGLAVSYAIVREHGGRIVAQNRPGGGAVFTVTLPTSSEA